MQMNLIIYFVNVLLISLREKCPYSNTDTFYAVNFLQLFNCIISMV